ncbi:MAG: tRNA epoxyqueuosine(34) reductase QueG [Pseudomonadota bacterium]
MTLPLKERLKEYAASIGFDRIGITSASPPDDYERYRAWIANGHAGEMWYLTEPGRIRKRGDLSLLIPGARSVIVGAISYKPVVDRHLSDAKFARYAWGEDYHKVFRGRLRRLERWLVENLHCSFESKVCVDTAPVLERSLAKRAGVGWIGKNCCLIDRELGSYILLGELITTIELPPDEPAIDRCGGCTKCLAACPTGALLSPYELDSRKCISYWTIESRADMIPEEIARHLDGWVAGCDICQEVCPWNYSAPSTHLGEFAPLLHVNLSRDKIQTLDAKRHKELFENTSLKRISLPNLKRNTGGRELPEKRIGV